jgi:hypothetical protein
VAAYNKINQFVQDLANKKHDLSADTFKVMLSNTATIATNAVYADVSGAELANGNGYATGGSSCSITSSTQTSGTEKWILAQLVFTASGSMGPFRYATLYNFTQASPTKPLIAWWDYGFSVTLASGDTFTVGFDITNGVLTIA